MVTLIAHSIKLALVLKHSIQIATHCVSHSTDSLLYLVCLAVTVFQVHIFTTIDVERCLQFMNHVSGHRIHTLNLLRVLTEFWT